MPNLIKKSWTVSTSQFSSASARSVDLYKKKQIKLNSRVAVGEVNMDEGHFLYFFAHLFFTSVSMYVDCETFLGLLCRLR